MKKNTRVGLVLGVIFVLILSGSQRCDSKDTQILLSKNFGVDGANSDYLANIAELGDGISGVNGVKWEILEPKPPLNGRHFYSWKKLDKGLKKFKDSGRAIQFNIIVRNPWAMELSEIAGIDAANGKKIAKLKRIKPGHAQDWSLFIYELVKRYPEIKFLQIGSEEENAWADVTGYIQALCLANIAAKRANPEIIIMAAGFNLGDFFTLSDAEKEVFKDKRPMDRKFKFIGAFLADAKDCFDVLSIHLSGREKSIPQTISWYRDRMEASGYTKPIWSEDTASAPSAGWIKPLPQEEKIIVLLKSDRLRNDRDNLGRFLKMQAGLVVKKSAVAFASGVERVFISSDVDFHRYYIPEWRYMGLIDYKAKARKPAFYTYKMLISKIDGFLKAEKINDCIYKFSFRDKNPVFIAWVDSGTKTVDFSLYIRSRNLKLTHIITEPGQTDKDARIEEVPTNSVKIDEVPVFIEG